MTQNHDHAGHDHANHDHGHHRDRGVRGAIRYLRWLPEMWHSDVNDAVIELVAPRSGERGVDIGAGLGAGAFPAAAAGAHVVAVEPTPLLRWLLQARRAVSRRRKLVTVADGAAERIPLDDESVDVVWAVNTMHHWLDLERGVAEIARVLRPRGRAILVDEDFTDPTHPEHEQFGDDHGPEAHGFTAVTAERVSELLTATGFSDVDTSIRDVGGRPVVGVVARR